ncbi:glycolipid transfer protein isoform X2 [Tachypleus tridentatus]|uniref:glycolipid transfer protein isoform X2 n=1 Tax=Tachypleus tridentatus TaxID=6853 RepID=UPI003FD3CC32
MKCRNSGRTRLKLLGKAFLPVKYDVNGNIEWPSQISNWKSLCGLVCGPPLILLFHIICMVWQSLHLRIFAYSCAIILTTSAKLYRRKLQTIYKTDELKFKHLSSIVIHEMNDDKDKDKVGTDALLWLKRALQYIQVFLSYFVEDYVQGNCTEDLVPFFRKAYEEKLKQYHGFIIQNLFGLCLRAAPGRKQLIVLLSNGKEDKEGEVFDDLKNFLVGMTANLDIIVDLYKKYNFEV